MSEFHRPIMTQQVLELLNPTQGGYVVDCTVGGGGHAEALLARFPDIKLIGLDRDASAIAYSERRLARFGQRKQLIQSDYRQIAQIAGELQLGAVSAILFDLGVSSHQLDSIERGFSYWEVGPLDMRMDRRQQFTAADLLNQLDERELERIIRTYGEERWARRIASFIVHRRQQRPLQTTDELVELIKAAIPSAARRGGPHPARRTFQALRIAVNAELDGLEKVLHDAIDLLQIGGRICVLAFHSLEDRTVKRVFRQRMGSCQCPPTSPVCICGMVQEVRLLTTKPWRASPEEREENPRSRSALLRAAERIRIATGV